MTSSDTRARNSSGRRAAFRPDIEGLRAVAIGLVLLYHAGVPWLPGGFVGVDVFFVISGFLITGLLIREIESDGRVSLRRFYARRAKRLLPATGVVLAFTAGASWLTASVVEWRDFGLDIVSSALYVVNWRLAGRSVDYLAEDVTPSPVQHFWSLAVEEQFYIVWPLLLVLLAWWLRRRPHARLQAVLTAGILLVILPSFGYSLYLTATNPATAFFVTPTRLWELGIGALVAIGASLWTKVPTRVAVLLGWAGLAVVAASGVLVSSSTAWPGYAALAPTLGTAAVIIAGYRAGGSGAAAVLSARPAVAVGALSYSLYLWHWPFVVAATAYWGELTTVAGLLVVALSAIPAFLCYRFVENPIRFARPLAVSHARTGAVGAGFTAVGVAAGLVLVLAVPTTSTDREAPGAHVLSGTDPDAGDAGTVESLTDVDWFTPDATVAVDDLPEGYAEDCQVEQYIDEPRACEWGDPDGEVTVAVVGDSKILQWQSALDAIAVENGWRIISHTKSACGFHAGVQVVDDEPYDSCVAWNEAVLAELQELSPDAVLTSQRVNAALSDPNDIESRTTEAMTQAIAQQWGELLEEDVAVIVLLDNPNPGFAVYECVAEHPEDLQSCTFGWQDGVEQSGALAQEPALELTPAAQMIDLRPLICPADPCVPVIGNVLLYRQTSHLTDTYLRTLTDPLARELVPLIEEAAG